jgi:hypothetical protein
MLLFIGEMLRRQAMGWTGAVRMKTIPSAMCSSDLAGQWALEE